MGKISGMFVLVFPGWRGMRYLLVIISSIFVITLLSSPACAEVLYMWTDEEGVVHITDNPRRLPPGDDVERIHYRDASDGEPLPDTGQSGQPMMETAEEEETVSVQTGTSPEEEARTRELELKLEQAREDYERAKERVEQRRRDYSRKSTRHNRDQYKHALEVLAEKREKIRELERLK